MAPITAFLLKFIIPATILKESTSPILIMKPNMDELAQIQKLHERYHKYKVFLQNTSEFLKTIVIKFNSIDAWKANQYAESG